MYQILLADDEPIILSGLQTFLPWEEYNCSVVGTARNGAQLLEKIRQLSPDIVLCDITMPICSGLDVLNRTSSENPEIVFIMLTNYSDFEKVQKALRGKAADYLLKIDLTAENLKVSLNRAIEERERRRKLFQTAKKEQPLFQAQLAGAEEGRKKEIQHWVGRLLSPEGGDSEQAAQELQRLKAGEACTVIEIHMGSSASTPLPAPSPEEHQRQQSFHYNLLKDLSDKMYCGGKHVLLVHNSVFWLYLWDLADLNSLEQFQSRLNTVFNDIALQQVHFLVTETLSAGHLKELRTQLVVLQMEYAVNPLRSLIRYSPSMDKAGYVLEAKRYVARHIGEHISIQDAASSIGITPNYLSSLFKRQLGQNFVDYVNEQKIERACILLRSGQYLVYNISHMLGYENAYYFAKVFKKHMHMTPTEWQAQNKQD